MKKGLLIAFGLMAAMVLSACGNKITNNQGGGVSVDEVKEDGLLTLDELDNLEENLFPVSYSYKTYKKVDGSVSDTGEYVYPPDDKFLLPIDGYVTDKKVSSSEVKNGKIYTVVDGKLGNEAISVLYINDPETLKYSFATVYGESETTLYTFSY